MIRFAFVWGILLLLPAACGKPDVFHVESFAQSEGSDIRLNEPLLFRFSHEIDRSSIGARTARIVNERGEEARGRWVVLGRELRFLPRLPLEPDCEDAGLSPGQRYTVHLTGYPAYCAVLSIKGTRLVNTSAYAFRTVSWQDDRLAMFEDPEPEAGLKLIEVGGIPYSKLGSEGVFVEAGTALELVFSEPLFPHAIHCSRAKILMIYRQGGTAVDQAQLALTSRILDKGPRGAVVVIEPEGGFQKATRYNLFLEMLDYTDFGGRPLETHGHITIDCSGGSTP